MYYAAIKRTPFIFWSEAISGVEFEEFPLIKNSYLRTFCRKIALTPIRWFATKLWAIGKKAEYSFIKNFPEFPKQAIIHYSYYSDLEPFFNVRHSKKPKFTFLFCGSLSNRKGFDLIIEAIRMLSQNNIKNFIVRVIGEGPLKEAVTDEQMKFYDFCGFVQRPTLPMYFQNADAMLFPSRYDGWGISLLEGLSAGLPIITSCHTGVSEEIVLNNINGFVLEKLTSSHLSHRMEWCINKAHRINKMRQSCRNSAQPYHISIGAQKFIKILMARSLYI
jgi:glycosyltransferase involved in cell wall biosynthesis